MPPPRRSRLGVESLEPRALLALSIGTEDSTGFNPTDNLVQNGSFEETVITNDYLWDTYGPDELPKWTLVRTGDIKAEIQKIGLSSWVPSEGRQWIELDGDETGPGVGWNKTAKGRAEEGLYTIQQDVSSLTAGEAYSLSFDFAARPGTNRTENQLRYRVLDAANAAHVVAEADLTAEASQVVAKRAPPRWRTATELFVAPASGQVRIEFTGLGPNNTLGMFLDNVVLRPVMFDLDVDSDNTGEVERSMYEESIEEDISAYGVLLGDTREPLVVEVTAGMTGTLMLGDGADKVVVWTSKDGGSPILHTDQPSLALAAPTGASSTVWTYWIEAIAGSDSPGDISFMLVPAGASLGSPLVDLVRATSLLNRAPEFDSETPAQSLEEDFYSFTITIGDTHNIGILVATDDDGDALEYSGGNDDFLVNADGSIVVRPDVVLSPGVYHFSAMVQDPHGEADIADLDITVLAPDQGIWIDAVHDATEGGQQGVFRVSRSDASQAIDVTIEPFAAPFTRPADSTDYVALSGAEIFAGATFTVRLEPGQYEAGVFVTALEDGQAEYIEDLSLQITSYATSGVSTALSAYQIFATIMLLDADMGEGEWQKIDPEGRFYRALRDDANLEHLAELVTQNPDDWTSIWPSKRYEGLSKWRNDDPFKLSALRGAVADVSNLIADTGVKLVLFGQDTGRQDAAQFVQKAQVFFADYAKAELTPGKKPVVAKGVDSAEELARHLKKWSRQGHFPIHEFVFVSHWRTTPIPAEDIPNDFANWDAAADVKLNENTLETAAKMKGPVRGWFTRTATMRLFGCNTDGLAQRLAEDFLPVGATAFGTTETAFCGETSAGFDQDEDDEFDKRSGEDPWKTVAELWKAPEWRSHDGAQ